MEFWILYFIYNVVYIVLKLPQFLFYKVIYSISNINFDMVS